MRFSIADVLIVTFGAWVFSIEAAKYFARAARDRAARRSAPAQPPSPASRLSARALPGDMHPRAAGLYTISDIPLFLFLAYTRDSNDVFARGHRALCRAYEVPEHWAPDQYWRAEALSGWRERGETPAPIECGEEFPSDRGVFAFLQAHALRAESYRERADPRSLLGALVATYDLHRKALLELDIEFFGRVYGADGDRVFTVEELERRWGMPAEGERTMAWNAWKDAGRSWSDEE